MYEKHLLTLKIKEVFPLKKKKYSEEQIREILTTAYPGKTEKEIDVMVQETMNQYLEEAQGQAADKKD